MIIRWYKFSFKFALMAACILGGATQSHAATWQQPPVMLNPIASSSSGGGALDSDANGHAIAILGSGSNAEILAYYYTNGSWGSPQSLFTAVPPGVITGYTLSMNPSGQAIAVWGDGLNADSSSNIYSAFFDGASWSTPTPNPLGTSIITLFQNMSVSMNASGDAILTTLDTSQNISYAQFIGGTWTALQPVAIVGVSNFLSVPVAYSDIGTAAAAWFDSGFVFVDYFDGVWQVPVNVGAISGGVGANPEVGIDSNGNAIALWTDGAGNVEYSYWNGSNWTAAADVSAAPGNSAAPSLSMAPGGTAIAAWIDGSGDGIYNTFDGSAWGTPAVFSPGIGPFADAHVSTDESGNALIVYTTSAHDTEARSLPLGGALSPVESVVTADVVFTNDVLSSLSSNGVQFALMDSPTGEGTNIYGSATLFVPPPSPNVLNINGNVCKNKFASQSDLVKTIRWSPLLDPTVVSYSLSRNGVLIASIPSSGPFIFRDHHRCKKGNDTYTLIALNASGAETASATIRL